MTKLINFLCIIPFFMVLSTILVIDYSIPNGITFGKQYWFFLSIGITSLFTIISFVTNKKSISLNYIDILITVFLILGLCLSTNSIHSSSTKLSLFILLYIFYFFLKSFSIQKKSNVYFLTIFFLIVGLAEAIWAFLQIRGYIGTNHPWAKTTGSLFNPGPYGGYIAMIIPMAFYYLIRDLKSFKYKINKNLIPFYVRWFISLLCFILIAYILPKTESRAAWIASVFSCIVVFLCYLFNGKLGLRIIYFCKKYKWIIVITAISLIGISGYALNKLYHMRKGSADVRALIWKVSLKTIEDNKYGVGIGNYLGVYADEQASYLASEYATEREKQLAITTEYAYNEYLHICVEFGILGLIIFLLIIFGSLISGIKNKRFGYIGSLMSLLTFSLMSYPFSIIGFLIAFIFLLVMSSVNTKPKINTSYPFNIITLCLLSIICVGIACYKLPSYYAHKHWEDIKKNKPQYENILAEYDGLQKYLEDNVYFLEEYSREFYKENRYDEAISVLNVASKIGSEPSIYLNLADNYKQMQKYDIAEEYYYKAINSIPKSSLFVYYKLAELYIESKSTEKAQNIITKLNPNLDSTKRLIDRLAKLK